MTQPNDFGGGFDATDESTKVAAPPLSAIAPPNNLAKTPIPTNHQPTDAIGIRSSMTGEVYHPLGHWDPLTGTTDAVGVPVGPRHETTSAGTQPIDTSSPL